MSNRVRLPGETDDGNPVQFEIISARIAEKENDDNKHVVYTVQVRHMAGREDVNPVTIERRYTNFYNLYTALKQDFPELLSSISFPRKVLVGNFDDKLISTRSTGFESLLKLISSESRLLYAPAVLSFIQDIELQQAKDLMKQMRFDLAIPVLENNFRILNKVYTDRSRAVLLALCRLLGCCSSLPGSPHADKWVELTLHRYEGVSDSELLSLYIPLLHLAIKLNKQHNKSTQELEDRLVNLHQRGICITNAPSLLDALNLLEKNYKHQVAADTLQLHAACDLI